MALPIHSCHHHAVDIEERRVHAIEHALFHPLRGSVVSITNHSLQEIDPVHGAVVGETTFDLLFLAHNHAATTITTTTTTSSSSARLLEHLTPAGAQHVVGVFQSRCLVVWDLQDAVLQSVTEMEKQPKSIAAVAASLCKAKWLFYASDGSNSIKVARIGSTDPPKKIARKAATRSSHISALAYDTPSRLVCAGASDGALQLWTFSEENTLGGKEAAAQVTPFFVGHTTQAPVVHLSFHVSQGVTYLVVGYQTRVVDVWTLSPLPPRQREPYRMAVLHCLAPHVADFSKKNGEFTVRLHPRTPVLNMCWHGYNSSGVWTSCTELRVSSPATGAVTLSNWHELLASSPHDDGRAVVVCWTRSAPPTSPLVAYVSTNHHHRQLLPLNVTSPLLSAPARELPSMALSTSFQLNLDQYFTYHDVPSTQLQITRNAERSTPHATVFQLQKYSLRTGEIETLDDLPVWNNDQGRQLVPWKLQWNEAQSALCIQLRNPMHTATEDDAGAFPYVVVGIKAKARGLPSATTDGEGSGEGSSSVHVTCGGVQEALDVCLCDSRPDDATQNHPLSLLLVLASTGKSIDCQLTCDTMDQHERVLLHRPVRRVFTTPFPLQASSAYAATVGSRLLYVLASDASSADSKETLVLSDEDLSVPRSISAATSFTTRATTEEQIVDVVWNAGASTTSNDGMQLLAAVRTTHRLVVLTGRNLVVVAAYDLQRDLASPYSVLWVAQTLCFVTSDHQLRYVTPLRHEPTQTSHLLCSLPSFGMDGPQLQLLSVCGDRLCYAATDPTLLETTVFMRPLTVWEPLLLGYAEATDSRLQAIFERDFLVFLQSGGQDAKCPVTDSVLEVMYHECGWTETVIKAIDAMLNRTSTSEATSSGTAASSSFKTLAHLSPTTVASLLLHAHQWRDAVRVFLANDPALEEYALAEDESASSAKLPSRTGAMALHMQRMAEFLASVGQPELAVKCLDVAGDDLGIVELLRLHAADASASQALLSLLQKDWAKLNPPLAAITMPLQPLTPSQRCHDLFSLLCCEQLTQTERRSRLLASVRPLAKHNVAVHSVDKPEKPATPPPGRAGILYWKRLSPEDTKDTIGASSTPHFSSDEPKHPSNYALFYGLASSTTLGGDTVSAEGDGGSAAPLGQAASSSSHADASAKMTIGPFLEDEDAVVAYWRFEEGASAHDDDTKRTLESMDTTKRENHVQIRSFASLMTFATCTAPVDKGEEGKLQEAFSLRFPMASAYARADDPDDWGATCAVRTGSTLDVGFVFDEDPYRRKLTFEAWIRNVVLFRQQQAVQETESRGDDDAGEGSGRRMASPLCDDASLRRLVCRRGVDKATWWEFGLCDGGHLFLTFGGQRVESDTTIPNAAAWQHVAFSVDILSPNHAVLKLFLQAACVASKEISTLDVNQKLVAAAAKVLIGLPVASMPSSSPEEGVPPPLSTMHLGYELTDYEMTEVRVWATARTAEQLSDMKENYLGIAEAKRRMKITIHPRHCTCDKCRGRRTNKTPVAKVAFFGINTTTSSTAFPATPSASSGNPTSRSGRDRRRPQPKS